MTARPLPPPLAPGARIGLFAPAGTPDPRLLACGVEALERAGYEVLRSRNLERRERYLAGADDERLAALEELLDRRPDALLAARGGYGVIRILPRLPWRRLAAWRGWLVGFSDLTALHAAAAARLPVATLLGPMGTTLAGHEPSLRRLLAFLRGEAPRRLFPIRAAQVVRPGRARGVAVGGNLSVLASLVGTPFEPGWSDAIVFLEDVNEPLYRLDRLLTQLVLSSRLSAAKAIVAGTMQGCGRGEPGWRRCWRDLLAAAAPPGAVVVEGLGFGHGAVNGCVPLGAVVEVDTDGGEVRWEGAR